MATTPLTPRPIPAPPPQPPANLSAMTRAALDALGADANLNDMAKVLPASPGESANGHATPEAYATLLLDVEAARSLVKRYGLEHARRLLEAVAG